MFKLSEIVKDWKESGALQAHINLYGFWDEDTFLTKSGDLGMVLRVRGIDYESLDHASRDHAVKRLEAALRTFDSRVRVYQALFKANEPAIPHRNTQSLGQRGYRPADGLLCRQGRPTVLD